ncbi:BQ5605_C047g12289 [Microbotryum silenes-dioicae]|uniref:BQ5605_C047g12289 protein n=1 Tax=Microbotryum silenes-dioicae TaxID=796604 RepID=A0A2X0PPL8_9BASI|nr:BQ5605_C047g12289 [Microbotryum silenes-dioicae]
MNMTIAELLAFDVAPADASLHIELSKDEHTQYSTLSSTRCLVLTNEELDSVSRALHYNAVVSLSKDKLIRRLRF